MASATTVKRGSSQRMPTFNSAFEGFVTDIESLGETLPAIMFFARASIEKEKETLKKFLSARGTKRIDNGWEVSIEEYESFLNIKRKLERAGKATKTIPRSFVVALVSQFDALVGGLLRTIFYVRPELLDSSERVLTFKELTEFGSVENAREYVVEKEVEAILRSSHTEQFDWMERKFKVPLRRDLPVWPTFIELTERRNLFVHCNGFVSNQYLTACKAAGVSAKDCAVGVELNVTAEYFDNAYSCIYELGFKLAHVLWRKLKEDERETADNALNYSTLSLIREEKYKLAKILLDFAVALPKFSSDEVRRITIINRAQVYKWTGDPKGAQCILSAEDWTASSLKFQLAYAVLVDDHAKAATLMEKIGADDSPKKTDYQEWPLFREFRKSREFCAAYEAVFKETFGSVEEKADVNVPQ